MSDSPLLAALNQVSSDDDVSPALPTLEAFARSQPAWITPVAALARAAESIGDWESAFELWTQARRIAPQAEAVNEGVKRSALRMALPKRDAVVPADNAPSEQPTDSAGTAEESHASAEATTESSVDLSSETKPVSATSSNEKAPRPLVDPIDFDITDLAPPSAALSSSDSSGTLDELDNLINRLEGARIVPKEDADVPAPKLENDVDDMVSETLATIYLNQQQFGEAARVFDRLAEIHPERAEELKAKAADARQKQAEQTKK